MGEGGIVSAPHAVHAQSTIIRAVAPRLHGVHALLSRGCAARQQWP
jgi:hypothetical protein